MTQLCTKMLQFIAAAGAFFILIVTGMPVLCIMIEKPNLVSLVSEYPFYTPFNPACTTSL